MASEMSDNAGNGGMELPGSTDNGQTTEQKVEEILAAARDEAKAILEKARTEAVDISGRAPQSDVRSPVAAATERVLAKARAAASEIRANAASLTGEVRDKVLASADEVLDHARSAAREFR